MARRYHKQKKEREKLAEALAAPPQAPDREAAPAAETPPVQPGDRLTVRFTDVAFGGEGVARAGEFVIFAPFVIDGELAEVRVEKVKPRFARARLLRVIEPSPHRVEPRCPYFGVCGGCQYQHIAYERQLELKRRQVREVLHRLGGVDPETVRPPVPCPRPYHYRNRLMVRSWWSRAEERMFVGFLRRESRWVVDVEECALAEPALNEELRRVRADPPRRSGLKKALRLPPEGWVAPPDSFFQNNFFMLPKLAETARERLADAGSRFLIDAYCGVGFFAVELAGAVERFAGVEIDAQAVRAARLNAARRGAENGEFIRGSAEEKLPRLLADFTPEASTIILDPPRVGCAPSTVEALRAARPAQILYVSCHPATLARDLKRLCEGGLYAPRAIVPLDMFPQTQHVECVADLRKS